MILVALDRAAPRPPLDRHELRLALAGMLQGDGGSGPVLELACLPDAAVARLNRESLGCPGPTNILAFPAEARPLPLPARATDENGPVFLGWLALGLHTLYREAALYGQRPAPYCLTLLAHGLAHLLGHEHGAQMELACRAMLRAVRL